MEDVVINSQKQADSKTVKAIEIAKTTKKDMVKAPTRRINPVTMTSKYALFEGFEGETFPPAGWLALDEDGDENNWVQYGWNSYTGMYGVASASWIGVPVTPDNWLISPQVNISNATHELLFHVVGQDADWSAENYSVLISTTGTAVADFTEVYNAVSTADWEAIAIDLAAYDGQDIYIAFRHHNISDMYIIVMDDIYVYDTNAAPECPSLAYPMDEQEEVMADYDGLFWTALNADSYDVYLGTTMTMTMVADDITVTFLLRL